MEDVFGDFSDIVAGISVDASDDIAAVGAVARKHRVYLDVDG